MSKKPSVSRQFKELIAQPNKLHKTNREARKNQAEYNAISLQQDYAEPEDFTTNFFDQKSLKSWDNMKKAEAANQPFIMLRPIERPEQDRPKNIKPNTPFEPLRLLNSIEDIKATKLRYEKHEDAIESLEIHLKELDQKLNEDVLQDLLKFTYANTVLHNLSMPSGILFTGSTTDNTPTCEYLREQLYDRNIFTCILDAKTCSSMKSAMDSFASQWFSENYSQVSTAYRTDPLQYFLAFYTRFCKGKTITFMLPDFEYFDPKILQDLVSLCGHYHETIGIPFSFIFFVSGYDQDVLKSMSQSVLANLEIQKFVLKSSNQYVDSIIADLIVPGKLGFYIGPETLTLLLENYKYRNGSISSFIHALKYIIFDHYYSNPLSILSIGNNSDEVDLSKEHVDYITSLSSLKDIKLPSEVAKFVLERCKEIENFYVKDFDVFFQCFLLSATMKTTTENYERVLKMDELYIKFVAFNIKLADPETFLQTLTTIIELLATGSVQLQHTRSNLIALTQKYQQIQRNDELGIQEPDVEVKTEPIQAKWSTKKKRNAQLNKAAVLASPLEKIKTEIAEFLFNAFKAGLAPISSIPLSEPFYYNNYKRLEQTLTPKIRVNIKDGLTNPQSYFPKMDTQSLFDICYAYKIYSECGRYINLHDWYVSFQSCFPTGSNVTESKTLQARFEQAVSELRILGLIHPTKRKPDHVEKILL